MKQEEIRLQPVEASWLQRQNIILNVLRLDELHPVVSGNKWFKLQHYLAEAIAGGYKTIATFGGAYSNHIVATAFACKELGINSIGVIRGEKPANLSHTLRNAEEYGMQLHFVTRTDYKEKIALQNTFPYAYWINEGGYGFLGAAGAKDIFFLVPHFEDYTHLVCAAGTGTTLAGLIKAALPHQYVLGISALKNNVSLTDEVRELLDESEKGKPFSVLHNYHFGGYAKHTPALLSYMNEVWQQHNLPTDFVYTAKAFYGLQDSIINRQLIAENSRVLFIHTGGLQGNLSLPEGVLSF